MNTVELERAKYTRMWTEVPGYRINSPGERLVDQFLKLAQWDKGDDLIDCGSGTGRAARKLSHVGLVVTMADITPDATDAGIDLPFIECCLWENQARWNVYDWVYCCDVLEHIPTEHVDATLDNLAGMTGYGAFLQIALFNDGFGARIGDTLHLTVKPAAWWMEKIEKRWQVKSWTVDEGSYLVVMTGEAK